MRSVNVLVFVLLSGVALLCCGEEVEWQGEVPWQSGKRYETISTYEIHLSGLQLEAEAKWATKWKTSEPLNGYYKGTLAYSTYSCSKVNLDQGSVLRTYNKPTIEFYPAGLNAAAVIFVYRPDWVEKWKEAPEPFKQKTGTIVERVSDLVAVKKDRLEIKKDFERLNFTFAQVINGFEVDCTYLLSWDSRNVFSQREGDKLSIKGKSTSKLQAPLSEDKKVKREISSTGVEAPTVVQTSVSAESKMLSYSLFGQKKVRNPGEVWEIKPSLLKSFMPVASNKDIPFEFYGERLILQATKFENDSMLHVKVIDEARIDGYQQKTDLRILPGGNGPKARFDDPDFNASTNNIEFVLDGDYQLPSKVVVNLLLKNYNGPLPQPEHLSLRSANVSGDIYLKFEFSTTVSPQGN